MKKILGTLKSKHETELTQKRKDNGNRWDPDMGVVNIIFFV